MAEFKFSKSGPPVFRDGQSLTDILSYPLVADREEKNQLAEWLSAGNNVLITEKVAYRGSRIAWRLAEYYPERIDGDLQVVRIDARHLQSTRGALSKLVRSNFASQATTRGISTEELKEWMIRELESLDADQIVIVYDDLPPELLSDSPNPHSIIQEANEHCDATISVVTVLTNAEASYDESKFPGFYHLELGPFNPAQVSMTVEHQLNNVLRPDTFTESAGRCATRLAEMYERPLPILSFFNDLALDIERGDGSLPITATDVASKFRKKRYKELKLFALGQSDHARLLLRAMGELTAENRTPVSTQTLLDRYETICEDVYIPAKGECTLRRKLQELRSDPSPFDGLLWFEQHTRQNERGGAYNTYRLAGDVDLDFIDFVVEHRSNHILRNFRDRFFYAGLSGTAEGREAMSRRHDLRRRPEFERQWTPPSEGTRNSY